MTAVPLILILDMFYLVGEVRSLRASRMTTTSASAITKSPGAPASSKKPVLGSCVVVGMAVTVNWACAAWVNAAATVAVCGSGVSVAASGVVVDGGMRGVAVGSRVAVAAGV